MVKLRNNLYISVYGYGVQYGMNTKHTYSTGSMSCGSGSYIDFDLSHLIPYVCCKEL